MIIAALPDYNFGSALVALIVTMCISIAIFMLLRFFILWYYKIDTRTKLLEDILQELKKMNDPNAQKAARYDAGSVADVSQPEK